MCEMKHVLIDPIRTGRIAKAGKILEKSPK